MSKVKNILFRTKIKGQGIVNFDSTDQKFIYGGTDLHRMKTRYDNVTYAKKNFYKDEEGKLDYKLKISSNCLRHSIFKGTVMSQSPNIVHNEGLLYGFIASPTSMLRGYLFADVKESFKRTGAFKITDAEQTCNALSKLDTFSKSGEKVTDDDITDNSFYKKESVGNVEYKAQGNIDLMELQFLSCDNVFDRFGFNSDNFELFKLFMAKRLPNFNSELGNYTVKSSIVEIPEHGFTFSNENIIFMVKEALSNLLKMNITKSDSFAKTDVLEYKLVYDTISDTIDNEDGWVKITSDDDVNAIDFEVEEFYVKADSKEALALKEAIKAVILSKKLTKKTAKEKTKKDSKTAKEKKAKKSE